MPNSSALCTWFNSEVISLQARMACFVAGKLASVSTCLGAAGGFEGISSTSCLDGCVVVVGESDGISLNRLSVISPTTTSETMQMPNTTAPRTISLFISLTICDAGALHGHCWLRLLPYNFH